MLLVILRPTDTGDAKADEYAELEDHPSEDPLTELLWYCQEGLPVLEVESKDDIEPYLNQVIESYDEEYGDTPPFKPEHILQAIKDGFIQIDEWQGTIGLALDWH